MSANRKALIRKYQQASGNLEKAQEHLLSIIEAMSEETSMDKLIADHLDGSMTDETYRYSKYLNPLLAMMLALDEGIEAIEGMLDDFQWK